MADPLRVLRVVLLAAGAVLIVVVVGTLGYTRLRARRFLSGLPAHLGVDIRQETNGFTYSQSVKGRTVFTVHAAKEVQRKDGTVTLHDVGILLYAREPGRVDRIHGSEFVYDQAHGILRAEGEVFLDLAAPNTEANGVAASSAHSSDARDAKGVLHVKTSALLVREKERSALTDAPLEFTDGALSGRAVGASYDGEAGTIVLRSAVSLAGMVDGSARSLHADRAEIHHADNTVLLEHARYTTGTGGGEEVVAADHALVRSSPAGRPLRIEAEGHVSGRTAAGASVSGQRGAIVFNQAGSPQELSIDGAVRLLDLGTQAHGKAAAARSASANSAHVSFDGSRHPAEATLTGEVDFREVSPGDAGERRLNAARAELSFAPGSRGRAILRRAQAFGAGSAVARLRLTAPGSGGESTTEVVGDLIDARFASETAGGPDRVSGLVAHGHAGLERTSGQAEIDRADDKSTADTIELEFAAGLSGAPALCRATESGSVVIAREAPARSAGQPAVVEHARARNAVFEPGPPPRSAAGNKAISRTGTVTLTGAAEVVDGPDTVSAERIVLDRESGDAAADGSVRLTYGGAARTPGLLRGANEPIHALGARALSHHAAGLTELFGAPGGRARMWGAGGQIEAPVIVVEAGSPPAGVPARLLAHGAPADDDAVHAVLPPGAFQTSAPDDPSPARAATLVRSGEMIYTEARSSAPDTISFRRRVRVTSGDTSLRADTATVTLTSADGQGSARRIREMVAEGAVALDQPGRKAQGAKLVYTAADTSYLLTGTPGAPPRLTDADHGTVTGSSVRFSADQRRAVVSGGAETGGRVRTETRGRP